jgi:putative cell wall-binding protein
MVNWKKKVIITMTSGLLVVIAFSLPIVPSTSAKSQIVKIQSDEHQDNLKQHFEKGKAKNLKIQTSGKDAILTSDSTSQDGVYLSPVIKSDITFTDVGVHWKNGLGTQDPTGTKILIRYSTDGNNWSAWKKANPDEALAEPGSTDTGKDNEIFSQLVYAEKSNYFQYQVQLDGNGKNKVKDIKVTFINSEDGPKQEVKKSSLWETILDKSFASEVLPSDVVSRASWGADESLRSINGVETWPREFVPVTHLFVHHTDTPTNDPNPPARIRSIYYYHTVTNGWGDIAYNAIIGSDGKIYEGRKGKDDEVLTPNVVGAGTYGFNKGGYSISVMGEYETSPLPANIRQKLVEMLAFEAKANSIDPTGISNFSRNYVISDPNIPTVDYNVNNISGHKDSKYTPGTLCPGDYIYNDLPNIRNDVKALLGASISVKRLAGDTRYGTSAEISKEISNLGNQSDTIILARGDLFPDALAAGPLAAKTKSPILLTDPNGLRAETKAEIQRRNPSKVIILGGTGAVSVNVETQVKGLGITNITRIAGVDRYDVAAITAEKVVANASTPIDSAFITLGTNFPDALSVTSVAGQKGMPILLVKTGFIPTQIQSFITKHPEIKKFYIIGGPAVISNEVKATLETTGATTQRLYGIDRYATAVEVTKHFNMNATSIVFANGANFPDALSGGPLAAYTSSPILLTKPNSLPIDVNTYLISKEGEFKSGYISGGTGVVTDSVKSSIISHMK